MNVAISVWNGRVSPVFDTSRCVLLIDADQTGSTRKGEHFFANHLDYLKIRELVNLGVDVLICGAVSKRMAAGLVSTGIAVIPWVSGMVDEVVSGFLDGSLNSDCFSMPGCRGRNRCRWGRNYKGGRIPGFQTNPRQWKGKG
jgi:predicted Fe-Mo cluster-binding NifX family protein